MRIFTTLFAIGAMAFSAMASAPIDYLYADFSDGMPEDFKTFDVDGTKLHFLMLQADFEQGDSWKVFQVGDMHYVASPAMSDDGKTSANDWLVSRPVYIQNDDATLSFSIQSINEQSYTESTFSVYVNDGSECLPDCTTFEKLIDSQNAPVNEWGAISVSLKKYAGKRVSVAIVNQSCPQAEILALKDFRISGSPGIASVEYFPGSVILKGEEFVPGVKITAASATENIKSATLTCLINGQTLTASATGLNLKKGQSTQLLISEELSLAFGEEVNYTMTVNVNGEDFDPVKCSTQSLFFVPRRKVVLEEQTGTWCGWCPLGLVATDSLIMLYKDRVIPIAIHVGGDVMAYNEYAQHLVQFGAIAGAAPSGFFDRSFFCASPLSNVIDRGIEAYVMKGGFGSFMERALAVRTYADADINIVGHVGRGISFRTISRFARDLSATDYRVVVLLCEEAVSGNGCSQSNYLCNYPNRKPTGGYESLPAQIDGFVHNHVARAQVYGLDGKSGVIPASITAGEEYVTEGTITVPNGIDPENCTLVMMIVDHKTGKVLNADLSSLSKSSIEEVSTVTDTEAPLQIYDLNGRLLGSDASTLPGGLYIFRQGTSSRKVRL